MLCVSLVFVEREMHLLNLEVSDSFNGDFIRVRKVIINICVIVAFMIPQHEIANFCWFIYLIRTFTENTLPNFWVKRSLYKKERLLVINRNKKNSSKQVVSMIYTLGKEFFAIGTFQG